MRLWPLLLPTPTFAVPSGDGKSAAAILPWYHYLAVAWTDVLRSNRWDARAWSGSGKSRFSKPSCENGAAPGWSLGFLDNLHHGRFGFRRYSASNPFLSSRFSAVISAIVSPLDDCLVHSGEQSTIPYAFPFDTSWLWTKSAGTAGPQLARLSAIA
jgi:hypothetical protein